MIINFENKIVIILMCKNIKVPIIIHKKISIYRTVKTI